MKQKSITAWSFAHKWTSIICTAFILMLCVTGLPLIFHDEIEGVFTAEHSFDQTSTERIFSLDELLGIALDNRPGEFPLYMSFDESGDTVNITTGPFPDAPATQMHIETYRRSTGEIVDYEGGDGGVMDFILQLHIDMFLGLPGMLFLGGMGILFLVAVVSGIVLYAPFMRKHKFGLVRANKSKRLLWLDLHNLFGIVTVAWVFVVGFTGVVNTLESPINDVWKSGALADLTSEYSGQGVPITLTSLDRAVEQATSLADNLELQFVAFPGVEYSTDHHYSIFFHGKSPLTERIITPAIVDARTGEVLGIREMPWYGKGLALSRPLHFGDYGGLPMKVLWALLDVATIIVLISGLLLWLKPDKSGRKDEQT